MIERCSNVIGKPKDWDEEKDGYCGGLPIRIERRGDMAFFVSHLEPSPDELEAIKAGAPIEIAISSPQHPVLQMGVGDVPGLLEPVELIYVKAGVTPNADKMMVYDGDGEPLYNCTEANVAEGWAMVNRVRAGNVRSEKIEGDFSIRWVKGIEPKWHPNNSK